MEKKKIKGLISGRLRKLGKYGGRISRHFADEDIHKFRIEVKKLRALLRMVSLELNDPSDMKLPKKLKKIYGASGAIRDIHLHLRKMEAEIENNAEMPEAYIHQMKERIQDNKKQLLTLLSGTPFTSIKKKIIAQLPESLQDATIDKFVHQKINAIATLIQNSHEADEDIHTIRKHLKDLMYNVKTFEEEAPGTLPPQLVTEHQFNTIEQLARKLGEYNDVCFATSFLEPVHLRKLKKEEKKKLFSINYQWLQHKEQLKQATVESMTASYLDIISKN